MSLAELQWPGVRYSKVIDGSGGEIVVSHGLIESSEPDQVDASLPPQTVLVCVHLAGSIWLENQSDFSRFSRLGHASSANLGIGGLDYDIRYRADRCQFARFLLAAPIFERALEGRSDLSRIEFIDPQNETSPILARIARRAVALDSDLPADRLLADSVGYSVAAEILRSWTNLPGNASLRSTTRNAETKRMQRVTSYIEDNLGVPMSLTDLASISGLSVPQFMRVFRAEFGMPPYRWIINKKIERSQNLIKSSRYSLTEIAHLLEFSSLQHFSAAFRRVCGISPTDYRTAIGRDQNI